MGNKFFISGVNGIDNDKCFGEVIKTLPDGVEKCIKSFLFDTDENAQEQEEILAFISGQSISGVKICLLKTGETSVFLGWNASGMDVQLCFQYLRTVRNIYPDSVVTCADGVGDKTDNPADLTDEAIDEAWSQRVSIMSELISLAGEDVVNIPAINYSYHLFPKTFAIETEGMSLSDKIIKLYNDIIDMQWYNTPEPKAYMLRWNTEITNFKMQDFEDCMKRFKDPGLCLSWSIWDWQDARVGDIVYLLRVGEGSTGIVMRGEIISEPYVDDDWSGKGREVHYVDFRVDQIMHPEKAVIPTTKELQQNWDEIDWSGGHSGTLIEERTAYQLEKYFDRYLVDNREQFSVDLDNGVAVSLFDIPTEYKDYFDRNQGHGGHWRTIIDDDTDLVKFLMNRLEGSRQVDNSVIKGVIDDEPDMYNVLGLATEDEEIGVCSLVVESKEQNRFITGFPELKNAGTEVTLLLTQIHEYANGMEAVLTCDSVDGATLSFFDSKYYLNKDNYEIGNKYTFKLAALASEAEILPEEGRTAEFTEEQTINMTTMLGTQLEKDKNGNVIPMRCRMDSLAYCLSTVDEVPDEYEFQSPVTDVKSVMILGTPMYRMKIDVVRTEDDASAVSIPLYAKKAFFAKKPKKNEPVRGWLWMLGALA